MYWSRYNPLLHLHAPLPYLHAYIHVHPIQWSQRVTRTLPSFIICMCWTYSKLLPHVHIYIYSSNIHWICIGSIYWKHSKKAYLRLWKSIISWYYFQSHSVEYIYIMLETENFSQTSQEKFSSRIKSKLDPGEDSPTQLVFEIKALKLATLGKFKPSIVFHVSNSSFVNVGPDSRTSLFQERENDTSLEGIIHGVIHAKLKIAR